MKGEKIFLALNNIDDELLNGYYEKILYKRKKTNKLKFIAMASCICIIVISILSVNPQLRKNSLDIEYRYIPDGIVVADFPTNSTTSYVSRSPNGSKLLYVEVENALKGYAGRNVTYFLAVDITSNTKELSIRSEELSTELQRLTKLGYHLGYSEAWEYQGEDEKVAYTYVAGYFTAEELKSFIVNKDYGYAFRFVKNGDGSPVSGEQGIISNLETNKP